MKLVSCAEDGGRKLAKHLGREIVFAGAARCYGWAVGSLKMVALLRCMILARMARLPGHTLQFTFIDALLKSQSSAVPNMKRSTRLRDCQVPPDEYRQTAPVQLPIPSMIVTSNLTYGQGPQERRSDPVIDELIDEVEGMKPASCTSRPTFGFKGQELIASLSKKHLRTRMYTQSAFGSCPHSITPSRKPSKKPHAVQILNSNVFFIHPIRPPE